MGNAWDRGADSLTGTRTLQSGEVFGDSRQEVAGSHIRLTEGSYCTKNAAMLCSRFWGGVLSVRVAEAVARSKSFSSHHS